MPNKNVITVFTSLVYVFLAIFSQMHPDPAVLADTGNSMDTLTQDLDCEIDRYDFIVFDNGEILVAYKASGHSKTLYLKDNDGNKRTKKIDNEQDDLSTDNLTIDGRGFSVVHRDNINKWHNTARKFLDQ